MLAARDAFQADAAGIALRVESTNATSAGVTRAIFDCFPALQKNNEPYRLLGKSGTESIDAVRRAFEHLALPSEVTECNGNTLAITKLVSDAEPVDTITQAEMADWLARVDRSRVLFGRDMSEEGELDNFLRWQGKLYWSDGNLLGAHEIPSAQALGAVEEWRIALQGSLQTAKDS